MSGYTPTELVRLELNAAGRPVNESHKWCRWPDDLVEKAKALRAEGLSCPQIGLELGVPSRTVNHWVTGHRRNPPARVRMVHRPVKEPAHD